MLPQTRPKMLDARLPQPSAKAVCCQAIESQHFGAVYVAGCNLTYDKGDPNQFGCEILEKVHIFFDEA